MDRTKLRTAIRAAYYIEGLGNANICRNQRFYRPAAVTLPASNFLDCFYPLYYSGESLASLRVQAKA